PVKITELPRASRVNLCGMASPGSVCFSPIPGGPKISPMRIHGSLFCAALAAISAALAVPCHAGAILTPLLVAAQGDAVGGSGLVLETARAPAIDENGEAAFRATVTGDG